MPSVPRTVILFTADLFVWSRGGIIGRRARTWYTRAAMNDAPVDCANCGARLTDQYCGRCGQDSHASLSFGHFLHEFFEGLFHVDSKFWRTLRALLTRPGLLTQEYLEGKRLRYSPPFRSYLVISIAYFVLASLFAAPSTWVVGPRGQGMRVEECAQMAAQPGWVLRWVPELEARCVRLLSDDQRVLGTALQNLLPKVMFVVLPLVALVQFWIFRRQRPLYLENLIFVLHFQSFYYVASTFALMLAAAAAALAGARGWIGESFEFVVYAWSVVYLFLAVRRVYQTSKLKTVLGLSAVAASYMIFWVFGVSIAGLYAFLRA
jgi:hypothetical protein